MDPWDPPTLAAWEPVAAFARTPIVITRVVELPGESITLSKLNETFSPGSP